MIFKQHSPKEYVPDELIYKEQYQTSDLSEPP